MFVSGSCDATARLWDTRVASRAVRTFHGHEGDVNAVKFFPDGNRFGTGSDDGTCRLFDIRTGHQLQVYHQQHGDNEAPHVKTIAFSISGRLLFAGYTNGDCYVWDTLLAKVCVFKVSLIVPFFSFLFSFSHPAFTHYTFASSVKPTVLFKKLLLLTYDLVVLYF